MVTYSNPVAKVWVLNDYAGFSKGNIKGTEIANPGFADKIVLECTLGENLLQNGERDWNPSFEAEDPLQTGKPDKWSVISAATGSKYIQGDPEGAFDGVDYVRIRNLNPLSGDCGQLVLAPNNQPFTLDLPIDPTKAFTVRYHGRYVNTQPYGDNTAAVLMVVDEDGETKPKNFNLFGDAGDLPRTWARTDYRLESSSATTRKLMMLWLYFGQRGVGPAYVGQYWDLDLVEIAETFPANPTYVTVGTYESPVLYTPATVSRVTWGTFAADTYTPDYTAISFFIRAYDLDLRGWTPYPPSPSTAASPPGTG